MRNGFKTIIVRDESREWRARDEKVNKKWGLGSLSPQLNSWLATRNNYNCLFSFHLLSIKWIEVKFYGSYGSSTLSVCGFDSVTNVCLTGPNV